MIQELISTSAPRCLDGNAGFGIVAQTQGMSPNVSRVVNALSGYTHIAAPGSVKNPVIYLHAIRQTGGMLLHIISRIADCGNDYSGRSNRIAHHWIIEEGDIRSLPGGPAELTAQNIFRSQWTEKPSVLPPRTLSSTDVMPKKCTAWEQMTGDAGWGGIVAERAEKRDPISIIFSPEQSGIHLRTLIGEALGLLPSSVRWSITFCTYSMKSHEAGGGKIQIKCFLADSEESQFARQSPDTLVIDLRQRQGAAPAGKYVELARGTVKPPPSVPTAGTSAPSDTAVRNALQQVASKKSHAEEVFHVEHVGSRHYAKPKSKNWKIYLSHGLLTLLVLLMGGYLLQKNSENNELGKRLDDLRSDVQIQHNWFEDEFYSEMKQQEPSEQQYAYSEDASNKEFITQEKEMFEKLLKSFAEWATIQQGKITGLTNEGTTKTNENKSLKTENEQLNIKIENLERQKDITEGLAKLPSYWEGLASLQNNTPKPLDDSDFLWQNEGDDGEIKDKVEVKYISFVSLEFSGKHEGISDITFDVDDSKLPMIFKLSYTYSYSEEDKDESMDADSNPERQVEEPRGPFEIARIELTGNGLQFMWQDNDEDTNDEEWRQIKNRILLAKIKITIGQHESHWISLWDPLLWESVDAHDTGMLYVATQSVETDVLVPFPIPPSSNLDNATKSKLEPLTPQRASSPLRTQTQIQILTYLVKLGVDSPNPDGDDLLLFREIRESK